MPSGYDQALSAPTPVGSTICNVVVEELDGLSAAMGVELQEDTITSYVRPNRLGTFDPEYVLLGVRIDQIAKSGWGLYFLMWWSKGKANLQVSIYLRDGGVAESILAAFKKSQSGSSVGLDSGREVYISRPLEPDKAEEQLPLVMQELIRRFSEFWSKAGGLGKFLKS